MIELLKNIAPAISSIGIFLGVIYVIVKEWRSGSSAIEKKTIEGYKERNNQLEGPGGILPRLQEEIKEITEKFDKKFTEQKEYFQGQIIEQGKEIAKLIGIVEEKDKHIKSLTEILQGKNPDMVNVLNEIKELNKKIINHLEVSYKETKEELTYQTDLLEKGKDRNEKIDEASKSHKGVPVMVPMNGDKQPIK